MLIPVTDLKQWAYCPRIVFHNRVMPGIGKPTFKMREAHTAQDLIEGLEMRRTLEGYGLMGARRRFNVWLSDDELGLSGRVDLLLETAEQAIVVDYKLTAGTPGENHRMQLAGYSLLAERACGVPARRGFLYRIPDNCVFAIEMTGELRQRVHEAVTEIRAIADRQEWPEATTVRNRCTECEFANYCGDVW